jgi:hypothetical protein
VAGGLNLSWLILNEEFCSLSKSRPANAGSVLEKVMPPSSTRNSVFYDKSQQFCTIYETFLQLCSLTLAKRLSFQQLYQVQSLVGKDKNVSVCRKLHYLQTLLSVPWIA